MSTPLTCTTGRRPDGAVVLTATGEIDMSNAASFAAALADTASSGGGEFVVDLTAVDYIDSAGLAAIFPHADRLRLLTSPMLVPVLTIAGLDDITTVSS
ncbi:STAS domain-containing protein [Actinoplanes solisilvae]|uniref:STAS domain-containing protein n=1 Tax=Actinoplanes solisilvae TaxID=2486853 RepID=UPI000FD6E8E8|nr:STAS domain-containing protein [Actinoplanes solisilvae]